MIKIPVFQESSSKFNMSMVLEDLLISLYIYWNSRSNAWYMDITDTENNLQLIGVKLVPNWLLIRQFRAYMPNLRGDFIVIKTDVTVEDRVTYDNLNNGYTLYFYDRDEAEAWEDENGVG